MPKSNQNIQFDELDCNDTQCDNSQYKKVGCQLREARMASGRELSDIALQLRISERYLQNIEDSEYEALPEKVYSLGFVRTYAHTLGLDCDQLVVEFKKEITVNNGPSELNFPSPVAGKSVPKMPLIFMTLALAMIIYIAWYALRMKSESSDQIQEPPAIVMEPAPIEEEVEIDSPEPVQQIELPTSSMMTVHPTQFQIQSGQDLTVFTQGKVWVDVRREDGTLVFTRMMNDGDLETFKAIPGMKMNTRNAGMVFLRGNGMETSALGEQKQVLEDFELPIKDFIN